MNNRHDNLKRLAETASDFARGALSYVPQTEPGEERDPGWLRWAKFISIIVLPAVLLGFVAFCEYYLEQYQSAKADLNGAALDRAEGDLWQPMKVRIAIGGVIGGGLGMIYVVRCLVRKVDP